MNNEPVAWMSLEGWAYGKHETRPPECNIPLYTHPVKEQDTECQYCKQGCIRCDARKQLTDEEIWRCHDETDSDNWVIDFARAILRKAQEK